MLINSICLRLLFFISALLAISGCVHKNPPLNLKTPTPVVKTNSVGIKMVFLPGGTFNMGDPAFSDAVPVHAVTVDSFWVGQYPITNAQFDLYKKSPRQQQSLDDNQPVLWVSWAEANAYCKWLSKRDKRHYRLPTEAEWEYAARGGLDQMDYPWGNESVDGRACFNQTTTCSVGKYPPNAFGLYDMVGNGGQWVSDWYDEHYYATSPSLYPQGPSKPIPGEHWHIIRGGLYPFFGFKCGEREPWSDEVEPISGFRIVMDGKVTAFNNASD